MSCKCQCCAKSYKVDLLIPGSLWEAIKPAGKPPGAGLLCGECIMRKIENIGNYNAFEMRNIID